MFTTKSATREATEEHDAMVTRIYIEHALGALCILRRDSLTHDE